MAGNDRGYDADDVGYQIENYQSIYGTFHGESGEQGASSVSPFIDYDLIDWATVTVTYPDGHMETRTFVGPWNDEEDLEHDIWEWFYEGTP